ncbi:Glucose oxidase [Apiospora arundinis]
MDKLPPKITQRIVNLVLHDLRWSDFKRYNRKKLIASYAAVSREWQALIEPTTFERLCLDDQDLKYALENGIFTPARQPYIRYLSLEVGLPEWESPHGLLMSPQHRSEVFFSALADLLDCTAIGFRPEDTHHRQLPEVAAVTSVFHDWNCDLLLYLNPYTAYRGDDSGNEDDHLRRVQQRKDVAKGLKMLPGSIREFTINEIVNQGAKEERYFNPLCEAGSLDPFSVALREFSKQLEILFIEGGMSIGHEFFYHSDLDKEGEETLWPRLRRLSLEVQTRAPQGQFIFNEKWRVWDKKVHPDPGAMTIPSDQVDLYCFAVAQAAARMPKLEFIEIEWSSVYLPSTLVYYVRDGRSDAEFEWDSSPSVYLSGKVQDAWWKAAQTHLRDGGEFNFSVEDTCGVRRGRRWRGSEFRVEPYTLIDWTRTKI